MGFWGLFEFALKCFYVVAWPCLALGYPLCASVRAVEAKSKSHTRKLVTYWILFALITLFEHAFLKLLERLPIWSYTKLAIVFWLAIPEFNGAVCAYKLVVQPCLSVELQTVISWFSRQKDSLQKGNTLLAEIDRYINDNGPEALEKLLAIKLTSTNAKPHFVVADSKSAADVMLKTTKPCLGAEQGKAAADDNDLNKCQQHSVLQKDVKTVEVTERKEATKAKQGNAGAEKLTFEPKEIKETTAEAEGRRDSPQIPAFKTVQKEWTCAMCLVTVPSEKSLNNHLKGRRHKAACEKLKTTMTQESKGNVLHSSSSKEQEKSISINVHPHEVPSHQAKISNAPKKLDVVVKEQEKCASDSGLDSNAEKKRRRRRKKRSAQRSLEEESSTSASVQSV